MKLDIISNVEVPEYPRNDVTAKVSFENATPSEQQIKDSIASSIKADVSLVVIDRIDTAFGDKTALVKAWVYKKKEDLEFFAPKVGKKALEKIKKTEEAKKAAEEEAKQKAEEAKAAAEEPAPEAPAEDAEAPAEEKTE